MAELRKKPIDIPNGWSRKTTRIQRRRHEASLAGFLIETAPKSCDAAPMSPVGTLDRPET